MDLTDGAVPSGTAAIAIPEGDPQFYSSGTGQRYMGFDRSVYNPATRPHVGNSRQQINQITAFLDGLMVYGVNPVRAAALRTKDGTGYLRTSPENLLPFNSEGLPNAGGLDPRLFLAGDIRAREEVFLTAMHTLFVREHTIGLAQ